MQRHGPYSPACPDNDFYDMEDALFALDVESLPEDQVIITRHMRSVIAEDRRCAVHRPLPRQPGRATSTVTTVATCRAVMDRVRAFTAP